MYLGLCGFHNAGLCGCHMACFADCRHKCEVYLVYYFKAAQLMSVSRSVLNRILNLMHFQTNMRAVGDRKYSSATVWANPCFISFRIWINQHLVYLFIYLFLYLHSVPEMSAYCKRPDWRWEARKKKKHPGKSQCKTHRSHLIRNPFGCDVMWTLQPDWTGLGTRSTRLNFTLQLPSYEHRLPTGDWCRSPSFAKTTPNMFTGRLGGGGRSARAAAQQ